MFRLRKFFFLAFVLICVSATNAQRVLFYHNGRLCVARTPGDGKLLDAVNGGGESSVRLLLRKGASARATDDCGNSLLIYAMAASRLEIIRLLIAAGADVNADLRFDSEIPLSKAISISDPEVRFAIVKLLIESGANVNPRNYRTPLMGAVSQDDIRLVELLISSGADVNVQDEHDASSAYSLAAELGNQKLKQALLAAGADPFVGVAKYRKVYAEHAFFQAAADGRVDVVEAMLSSGAAKVNMTNESKVTALMRARDAILADALLKAGADVDLQDDRGFTALMWAAEIGRIGVVKKLIAVGANVNLRRKDGKALIDLVGEDSEMDKLLVAAGASRQQSPR